MKLELTFTHPADMPSYQTHTPKKLPKVASSSHFNQNPTTPDSATGGFGSTVPNTPESNPLKGFGSPVCPPSPVDLNPLFLQTNTSTDKPTEPAKLEVIQSIANVKEFIESQKSQPPKATFLSRLSELATDIFAPLPNTGDVPEASIDENTPPASPVHTTSAVVPCNPCTQWHAINRIRIADTR